MSNVVNHKRKSEKETSYEHDNNENDDNNYTDEHDKNDEKCPD